MTKEETQYVPSEVRDGFLVSRILVAEAHVVSVKSTRVVPDSNEELRSEPVTVPKPCIAEDTVVTARGQTEDVSPVVPEVVEVPVQAAEAEALQSDDGKGDEKVNAEVIEDVLGSEGDVLVTDEAEGALLVGSADSEGDKELDVATIRQGMSGSVLAEDTRSDLSLEPLLKLGELDREGYHVSQGLLFRTRRDVFEGKVEQLCVPASHRDKCLRAAHTSFGHQGRNKMLMLLRPHFYWPNMSRSCRDFVRECEHCQAADKTTPKPQTMTERPVVTQPFMDVAIDLVGPFPTAVGGYKHMLTCIDSASRWPEAIPVRSMTTKVVIRCLTEIFSRCGFPEKLTTDNGSQFVSKEFKKWLRDKGIAYSRATPYHPQGNGVVERLHRTLNAVVLKTIEAKGNWARVLPLALYFLRCTPSASTGVSPFLLTHGWESRTPLQVLYQSWVESDLGGIELSDWILENQDRVESARDIATSNMVQVSAKRAEAWNRRAVDRQFSVGDSVWVRRPGLDLKLRESWVGPGTVTKKNSAVSYSVQTEERLIPTVHVQQLKAAHSARKVRRVTSILEQDSTTDEITDRFAEAHIQEQTLTETQQSELDSVLDRFKCV